MRLVVVDFRPGTQCHLSMNISWDKLKERIGTVLGLSFVAVMMLAGLRNCSYTCDTFDKYVLQCNGKTPENVIFKFDAPMIREDFIKFYDLMIVTAAARDGLSIEYDPNVGDTVVDELRRVKMLGVWREGNKLIVSNSLLTDGESDEYGSMRHFVQVLKDYTDPDKLIVKQTELQKGIYGAMTVMFESVTIRGKDDDVVLPMPFSLKKDFKTAS